MDQLIGPFGALIGASISVAMLWRAHERSDRDVIAQRDLNAAGWREQMAATNRVADALEQMVRDAAARHRGQDK